jgi:acetoin utilization protein AcuB
MDPKETRAEPEPGLRSLADIAVREWMTEPVVAVKPRDSLRAARQLMAEHRINQLPVVKDDRLVGIVTDRDLRDAYPSSMEIYRGRGIDRFADSYRVEEVMTFNVISVTPDTSLAEAIGLLRRHRIGALPVVEKGKLVGILARSDILDHLVARRP